MNKIDKHFMRIALDAMPPKPMSDEEVWRTSEEGKHYKIESETGEIKAGFGGKFNGQKVDPSKKGSSKSSSASAPKASASTSPSQTPKPAASKSASSKPSKAAPRVATRKDFDDVSTSVKKGLESMFHWPPKLQSYGDSKIEFKLNKRDASIVPVSTVNKWLKDMGLKADVRRERDMGWTGPYDSYTYSINLKNEAPQPSVPQEAPKPASSAPSKSNYIVENDGPSWKNEGLKAAREGKKSVDESTLRNIKAGSDRKFTVIEPVVQPPNAPRSVGLYSKRDPYGFRVITGARMTKGNTPGSQYVFEDNNGNAIRFGSLYGDSISLYEE